ncbi:peptidoglycan DD-metalloendopeptidase family protein (plasmid) [Pontibacillus sp. ALD_SL1]|uniref:murein hydrolase activator EnvC family protein n=1 Tax=Pontibacillus sp. ALD_SL1 TaxID=2777185 RepID=UPI001A978548|nr:M23 family metallopeptidase [Pontibacillus sp. ALD_SL1]QST03096.1 peptidoglycan DD-metalloendopeptidase family protein [Pontibacillus sp. ALD_SL1]
MKSSLKLLLSSFLSTSLLFSTVSAEDIGKLQSDIEAKESTINSLEEKKKAAEAEIQAIEKEINRLTTLIKGLDADIAKTTNEIQALKVKIEELEKQIKSKKEELEQKKKILAENVKVLYSKGDVSFMEYLFRSDSVWDFLDRFETIKDIAKANRELYDEVKRIADELEAQKEELKKKKLEQEKKQQSLLDMKKEQEGHKKEQLSLLKKAEANRSSIVKEIESEKNAIQYIHNQISAIIKKREEERRKREQQNIPSTDLVGSGQMMIPVPKGSYYISSGFGMRTHPITGVQAGHNGVDFAASFNTPILAADSGTVIYAGPARGYGNWVVIDHNTGYFSIYGHMFSNQIYVSVGQNVTKGQKIAAIGTAGTSTGYHLHFAVSKLPFNQNFVNPMTLF